MVYPQYVIAQDVRFDTFTTKNGLSSNTVYALHQDRKGFLWFGTIDGLNRYDGYQIKEFRNSIVDTTSISNNKVTRIFEDHHDNLWLYDQFSHSLNRLNLKTEVFSQYNFSGDSTSISIERISEDAEGNVVLQFQNNTHFSFDHDKNVFAKVAAPDLPIKDRNTASKYLKKALVNHIDQKAVFQNSNSGEVRIIKVIKLPNKTFWAATRNHGLYLVRKNTKGGYQFTEYGTFSNLEVRDILEDRSGVLWVSVKNRGVYKYAREKYKFNCYKTINIKGKHKSIRSLRAVAKTPDSTIWIGTDAEGILKLKADGTDAVQYTHDLKNPLSLGDNRVRSIFISMNGTVWIGHYGGFSKYNPANSSFQQYTDKPGNPFGIPEGTRSYGFVEDKDGKLWIAGWDFLIYFDPSKQQVIKHYATENLPNDNLREVLLDTDGILWIGSENGGFCRFDPEQETFKNYKAIVNNKKLVSENVLHLYQDTSNKIWIATTNGLALFNKANNTLEQYTPDGAEGFSGNYIYGILKDNDRHLWLSTTRGLYKFDPIKRYFRNYTQADGLPDNEFSENSFFKATDGALYFGGTEGFCSFYPEQLPDNKIPPQVVITDLKIFNKSIHPKHDDNILPATISRLNHLNLSYKHRVMSIEFSSMHYLNPEKNKYAYMLEGVDQDWVFSDSYHRNATYTNLQPGTYVFKVKAANSDGIWSEKPHTLNITVKPPFWATWWFRTAAFFVLAVLAFLIINARIQQIKKKQYVLSKQLESELNFLKSQVNPHFLFNTLNNIYALCHFNPPKAGSMIKELSGMMRYMIYECAANRVPLSKELNYLQNFIELQQLKSEWNLNVNFNIEGELTGKTIVPLLLVNFVENSFKHGDIHFNRKGYVDIQAKTCEKYLKFAISNSVGSKSEINVRSNDKGGIGIQNVKERLKLLYPNKHQLIINNDEYKFVIELNLTLN